MNTIIANIPEKRKEWFLTLFNQFKIKHKVLSDEELEDAELARWIDEGMNSKDVPMEKVFELLQKNGANR